MKSKSDMTTIELKKQIVSKLQTTDDSEVLEAMLRLLELETNDTEVYALNEHQKQAIEISRAQIKNGEFYTEEEADKITEEWLKRQFGQSLPWKISLKF